jgi:hypothetical protein
MAEAIQSGRPIRQNRYNSKLFRCRGATCQITRRSSPKPRSSFATSRPRGEGRPLLHFIQLVA